MPITFCSGDIFATSPEIALAHGCNCAGAMGKGIAVEFKRRWPEMYGIYKRKCEEQTFDLGDVFPWQDPASPRVIYNLGTQKSFRRSKATTAAVAAAVQQMLIDAAELGSTHIAMPLIGAGLGGLPAADVQSILRDAAAETTIRLIVCDRYEAGKIPDGE